MTEPNIPEVGSTWRSVYYPDELTYTVQNTGGNLFPWVEYRAHHAKHGGVGGGRIGLENWLRMVQHEPIPTSPSIAMCPGKHVELTGTKTRCDACRSDFHLTPFGWLVVPDGKADYIAAAADALTVHDPPEEQEPHPPVDYDTVVDSTHPEHCPRCGWPAIIVCCNGPVADAYPTEDWWAYCSNPVCTNHSPGARSNQGGIEW